MYMNILFLFVRIHMSSFDNHIVAIALADISESTLQEHIILEVLLSRLT